MESEINEGVEMAKSKGKKSVDSPPKTSDHLSKNTLFSIRNRFMRKRQRQQKHPAVIVGTNSLEENDQDITINPATTNRHPRGTLTVDQLVSQIDSVEIEKLNASVKGFAEDKVGNEAL